MTRLEKKQASMRERLRGSVSSRNPNRFSKELNEIQRQLETLIYQLEGVRNPLNVRNKRKERVYYLDGVPLLVTSDTIQQHTDQLIAYQIVSNIADTCVEGGIDRTKCIFNRDKWWMTKECLVLVQRSGYLD